MAVARQAQYHPGYWRPRLHRTHLQLTVDQLRLAVVGGLVTAELLSLLGYVVFLGIAGRLPGAG